MCPQAEDRIALLRQALTSRDAWQVAAALKYVAERLEHEHRTALVPELVELSASPLWASDARAVLERI
jgi:glycerol kinase